MALNETEIKATIRRFLDSNFLLGKKIELKDTESFLDSGLVDSTGVLEFVGFLQETWAIEVKDEELLPENFDSVQNLADFVRRKKA